MDWSKKKRAELVSESCEKIQTKCGCITLKGVVHHYIYDNGQTSDIVEMTAPYVGKKRGLYNHMFDIVMSREDLAPDILALKKIYKQELKIRRRQRCFERNKAKIAKLLPIWFSYDAVMGILNAIERTERRFHTRQVRRGEISANELNDKLTLIRKRLDNDRACLKHNFVKDINRSLRISRLKELEFDYGDACRLFGEDVWRQLLERYGCRVDDVAEIDNVAIHLFNDFALLYNIALPNFEVGDMVETIGFDGIIVAVALHRNKEVVAVGAIDDVRGRKALRALVGNERLAKILPKRVYQAVTRHEQFFVRGSLFYSKQKREESIIIY